MTQVLLHEEFDRAEADPRLTWLHPPTKWSIDPARSILVMEPDANTDYWQKTHYGFEADNGHFLHAAVSGDMVLTTRVRFHPVHIYDQAGLLVRISPSCWLKTSVEYEPGTASQLGVVVTNGGYSDWSTQEFPPNLDEVWLRVRREATDYLVEYSLDGGHWVPIRTAHLHEDHAGTAVDCGLYACSPKGSGFVAEFEFLKIETGRLQSKQAGI